MAKFGLKVTPEFLRLETVLGFYWDNPTRGLQLGWVNFAPVKIFTRAGHQGAGRVF